MAKKSENLEIRISPELKRKLKAAKKERGVPTIAFVGFQGGTLSDLADHVVWIPADNYGISEDAHQSLVHVLTQYLCARAERRAAGG